MDDFTQFGKLIEALRPWQAQLVVVGGWAHRLYRFHPASNPPEYIPVTTKDADVAFSLRAPPKGNIGSALKDNGFDADLRGDVTPPVTHYHLGDETGGFYAEFLVPLIGGDVARNGSPVPRTVETAGVTAQKLRYLDILLTRPWSVELDNSLIVGMSGNIQVTIPNPVSFIAQKLLIKSKREFAKQAQDALYIHDTIDLFSSKIDEMKETWIEQIRPSLPRKTARAIEKEAQEQFKAVTDIHRGAVRIPLDRRTEPEVFRTLCFLGLERIFR